MDGTIYGRPPKSKVAFPIILTITNTNQNFSTIFNPKFFMKQTPKETSTSTACNCSLTKHPNPRRSETETDKNEDN